MKILAPRNSVNRSPLRRGVLLIALTLASFALSPTASALPRASGSNCSSNWVNNPAALECFIQGEEETRNGVAHPHYVACTANGEIFCCQDNNHGDQDCDAVRRGGAGGLSHLGDLQIKAILESQLTMKQNLAQITATLDELKATIGEPNICSAPDYMVLPRPGVAGPTAYCRLSPDLTKLQVLVYNQGAADLSGRQTETRITFATTSGPVTLPTPDSVNTSTLVSGGSQLLEFPIPSNCTSAMPGASCDFTIGVDVTNAVAESNEANNTVSGTCFPTLF
jgi:CARDB